MSSEGRRRGGGIAIEILESAKRRLAAAKAMELSAEQNAEVARELESSAKSALDAATRHRKSTEAELRRAQGEVRAAETFLQLRRAEGEAALWSEVGGRRALATDAESGGDEDAVQVCGQYDFSYQGKLWCIPEHFQFPECSRRQGWEYWLKGYVHEYGSRKYLIKPFRELGSGELHSKELKNVCKLSWRPIYKKMMEAPGLDLPEIADHISGALVQSSYEKATDYLKAQFSYIFEAPEEKVEKYRLSTWSAKIKPSHVRKEGNEADIAKLPPPTGVNQPHKTKRRLLADTRGGKGKKKQAAMESKREDRGAAAGVDDASSLGEKECTL